MLISLIMSALGLLLLVNWAILGMRFRELSFSRKQRLKRFFGLSRTTAIVFSIGLLLAPLLNQDLRSTFVLMLLGFCAVAPMLSGTILLWPQRQYLPSVSPTAVSWCYAACVITTDHPLGGLAHFANGFFVTSQHFLTSAEIFHELGRQGVHTVIGTFPCTVIESHNNLVVLKVDECKYDHPRLDLAQSSGALQSSQKIIRIGYTPPEEMTRRAGHTGETPMLACQNPFTDPEANPKHPRWIEEPYVNVTPLPNQRHDAGSALLDADGKVVGMLTTDNSGNIVFMPVEDARALLAKAGISLQD